MCIPRPRLPASTKEGRTVGFALNASYASWLNSEYSVSLTVREEASLAYVQDPSPISTHTGSIIFHSPLQVGQDPFVVVQIDYQVHGLQCNMRLVSLGDGSSNDVRESYFVRVRLIVELQGVCVTAAGECSVIELLEPLYKGRTWTYQTWLSCMA